MKSTCLLPLIFVFSFVLLTASASGKERFSHEIKRATGDLNKDGIEDLAIVTQDTASESKPYRLQIFFKQTDGHFKLVVSTEKAINPAFPDGRNSYSDGNDFADLAIRNGVIIIEVQLLREHYEHKFRYQNGNFELIGFSDAGSDGNGTCSSVDFNLSTGMRLEKKERCDTDKVIRNVKKKVMIRPLPKLQDFQPLQSELF